MVILRSGIFLITTFGFMAMILSVIDSFNYDWSDAEYTWFFIFGFGCIISWLLFVLIVFKFTEYAEKYLENVQLGENVKFTMEEAFAIKEAFKWSIYRMENECKPDTWPNRQYRYERINEVKNMAYQVLTKLKILTRKKRGRKKLTKKEKMNRKKELNKNET